MFRFKILFISVFISLTHFSIAKSLLLNVENIFTDEQEILDVRIVGYSDTLMKCLDLATSDTLYVKCKTKSYSEELYEHLGWWQGTWPKVGGNVIMVTNFILEERVLFARMTESNYYRFWDPSSIPFANTVFEFPKETKIKPLVSCEQEFSEGKRRVCMDGFRMSSDMLNEIRSKNREMSVSLFAIFPFIFIGMWVFVTFIISKMGWSALSENFKIDFMPESKRVGIISATLNSANYSNALVLRYNHEGFYLRPVVLFRLFHKPIFVPWQEIKDVREKKILFTSAVELIIGDPFISMMVMKKSTFEKVREAFYAATKET